MLVHLGEHLRFAPGFIELLAIPCCHLEFKQQDLRAAGRNVHVRKFVDLQPLALAPVSVEGIGLSFASNFLALFVARGLFLMFERGSRWIKNRTDRSCRHRIAPSTIDFIPIIKTPWSRGPIFAKTLGREAGVVRNSAVN